MHDQLTVLRLLYAGATAGPWRTTPDARYGAVSSHDTDAVIEFIKRDAQHGVGNALAYNGALVAESVRRGDRELIVAMHEAFPLLLDAAEQLRRVYRDAANPGIPPSLVAHADRLHQIEGVLERFETLELPELP